ncbi:MAG: hypothetical protein QOG64_2767 [Acidimicrobiaceae bacterium]|jgi:hypothetical protein|nr:hypothetical protein [Acidimicrobiaceae bacterium]
MTGENVTDNTALRVLARLGLASRALLYAIVAGLAVELARGRNDKEADSHGALAAVARQPLGRILLSLLAVGLAGYAIWRFAEAVRSDKWPKRLASVGKGLIYVSLFAFAGRLILGSGGASDSNGKESDLTARLLQHSFGRPLVFVIGLAIVGSGLANTVSALTGRWKKHLHIEQMGADTRRAITVVAVVGLVARTIVFALVGLFVVRAAVRHDAKEATGLDGALKRLRGQAHGPLLLVIVAAGLLCYGVYCLMLARYRAVLEDGD